MGIEYSRRALNLLDAEVGPMSLKITKQTVTAPPRKLKGTWTVEYQEDSAVSLEELERWEMYRRARSDYFKLVSDVPEHTFSAKDFAFYLEQNWGIKYDPSQGFSHCTIVDEQKYTMFVLKYAGRN